VLRCARNDGVWVTASLLNSHLCRRHTFTLSRLVLPELCFVTLPPVEASGGYECVWAKVLREASIEVRIVDPKRVRGSMLRTSFYPPKLQSIPAHSTVLCVYLMGR
jgi:hypothetical protein